MKKKIILAIVLLLIIGSIVFIFAYNRSVNIPDENETNETVPTPSYEPPEPVHYDVDSWINDIDSNSRIVTIIGLTTCPHCQSYKPVAEKLSQEYGFKLYFLERDTMYYNEFERIKEKLGVSEELNAYPTTFITEGGNVLIQQPGYPGELLIADFYREYGLIK